MKENAVKVKTEFSPELKKIFKKKLLCYNIVYGEIKLCNV